MKRILQFSLIAVLAALCIAPVASARPRVFIGGYFGPGFYGPAYYGPWYGPGWGWGWGAPYGYSEGAPATGSVKIDTKDKNAEVYVDGAYAGTVAELKTFRLRPGDHNIELRDHTGNSFFQQRVDVIAGKTTKLGA